jgi:hypothetical protein
MQPMFGRQLSPLIKQILHLGGGHRINFPLRLR